MSRALLQQALDFCEFCWRDVSMNEYATNYLNVTIANLTQALAQPEPSPVAEVVAKTDSWGGCWVRWSAIPIPGMKLYTAPPAPTGDKT